MVPHKQRRSPTLFTGCEARTGKQILSAHRNCRNNDDSLKKKKDKSRGAGSQGKHLREIQHWWPKGTSVRGNTSLRRWFSITQHANLSLFKLAKYSPAVTRARPRHKYTGSGVGWGHQLRPALSAIGMHSRLVCQLLANGHLAAAMSHIAAVNTHTPLARHGEEAHMWTATCNTWYTI